MAGLVPAIHVFAFSGNEGVYARDIGGATRVRPEVGPMINSATPFFERLCAGMTI